MKDKGSCRGKHCQHTEEETNKQTSSERFYPQARLTRRKLREERKTVIGWLLCFTLVTGCVFNLQTHTQTHGELIDTSSISSTVRLGTIISKHITEDSSMRTILHLQQSAD